MFRKQGLQISRQKLLPYRSKILSLYESRSLVECKCVYKIFYLKHFHAGNDSLLGFEINNEDRHSALEFTSLME